MGNRANVVFANQDFTEFSPCVYLHWNGGPESIYSFLEELDRRHIRADQCYEAARFCQIVAEHFDEGQEACDGLCLGLAQGPSRIDDIINCRIPTDDSDNGFYLVCRESGQLKMRRFTHNYGQGRDIMEEWDELKVAREKKDADEHSYRAEFRKRYAKITTGKTYVAR